MTAADRQRLFTRLFFGVWAMVTCILLFCVVLLARELAQRGQSPLALPSKLPSVREAQDQETDAGDETRQIQLYFGDADGRILAIESQDLPCTDSTVENCRRALRALLQGPKNSALTPILPASARLRGVYILDGELVVDFSGELVFDLQRRAWSASTEALMVFGVVHTVAQDRLKGDGKESIRRVRFLVEGSPAHQSFQGHLDLSGAFAPDAQWLALSGGRNEYE